MNRITRIGLVAGAALVVTALAGCSTGPHSLLGEAVGANHASTTHGTPQAAAQGGSATSAPSAPAAAAAAPTTPAAPAPAATTSPKAPAASKTPTSPKASTGAQANPPAAATAARRAVRPPQPAAPTRPATSVAGLATAIAKTPHAGLAVCSGHLTSLVAAAGDLRGIGTTQYLVDTTCQGATGSSPDEVAIYQRVGASLERTAILYQPARGVPTLTAYPYLDGPHTVVLDYAYGAEWQLAHIGHSTVSYGPLER